MRVLVNYLYQYYPFTTASYLEQAFKNDSRIDVFRVGENRVPCADLIVNIEPCGQVITYPGRKSIYWEIDNHIHQGRDVDKYQSVEYVMIAQKHFLDLYPKEKTTLLPLAADPDKHKLFQDEPLKYDVGFLGNDTYPERRDLLERIGRKYKLLRSNSEPGEPYSRLLSQCKILFNRSMDNDVNMRFFEAMSIGRMLVSDKVEGQDELATDGEHYVSYTDWEDLDKKLSYYLTHDLERNIIATAGASYIRAKHTYKDRLEQILQVCGFY